MSLLQQIKPKCESVYLRQKVGLRARLTKGLIFDNINLWICPKVFALLVQLVERRFPKPDVEGSSPSGRDFAKESL